MKGISTGSARDRIINIHVKGEYGQTFDNADGHSFGNAIEELFIHELVHASLDKSRRPYKPLNRLRHKNDTSKSIRLNWSHWRKAIKLDKKRYVNDYAKTNIYEDLAESFVVWIALR